MHCIQQTKIYTNKTLISDYDEANRNIDFMKCFYVVVTFLAHNYRSCNFNSHKVTFSVR